jgi:uncharacterized membrane protein
LIIWGGKDMTMILGMDPWVFTAWIGTIIVAIFCVLYGIYNEYFVKEKEKKPPIEKKKITNKKEAK